MKKEELFSIQIEEFSEKWFQKTKEGWDAISKPLDGLGEFETLHCRIMAILEKERVEKLKKAAVIFCADNGIVEEGVSQCGQENTYLVAKLLGEGISTASTMARFAGVDCIPVDIGINTTKTIQGVLDRKIRRGTKNFLVENAMTEHETLSAIEVGIHLAKELKEKGYQILATGEMGIGNTTTSTALLCSMTRLAVEEVTGRGAGLSNEGLARKKQVIAQGLRRHELENCEQKEEVLRALMSVGGLDIAGMTGLYIGGAIYKLPIMIDGFISAVAALVASRLVPLCESYMIPSHSGKERGTAYVLELLKLKPFLGGNMALGEGTGAMMFLPVLDLVFDFYSHATTFQEGKIDQYKRQ